MDASRLRQIHDKAQEETIKERRHTDLLDSNSQTQEVIIRTVSSLVDYLSSRIDKVEVVNQLKSIGTPDVAYVVDALNSLHDTIKTHENTDLTEITSVMKGVLEEVAKIPKSHPEPIELPEHEEVDYTDRFKALEKTVVAVEKAIKSLDLNVAAPIVNVPQTKVDVAAPNYAPVFDGLTEVKNAVEELVFPDNAKHIQELGKKLDTSNKILEKILDRPVGGTSGGGATYIPLANDNVRVSEPFYATRIDDTTPNTIYIGKASVGASSSDSVWQIAKLDTSSGLIKTWAGSAGFTQVWDNRTLLTYN